MENGQLEEQVKNRTKDLGNETFKYQEDQPSNEVPYFIGKEVFLFPKESLVHDSLLWTHARSAGVLGAEKGTPMQQQQWQQQQQQQQQQKLPHWLYLHGNPCHLNPRLHSKAYVENVPVLYASTNQ